MSTNDLIESVDELTDATTKLLNETQISKQALDDAEATSTAAAVTATTKATAASNSANAAKSSEQAAKKSADDAAEVVTGGTATLEPEAGKIPLADSEGFIHRGWLKPVSVPAPDFHLPLISDIHIREGVGTTEFSRASGAYETNKNGELVWREVDEPRFERGGCVFGGGSTNLVTFSDSDSQLPEHRLNPNELTVNASPNGGIRFVSKGESSTKWGSFVADSETGTSEESYTGSFCLRGDVERLEAVSLLFTDQDTGVDKVEAVIYPPFVDGNRYSISGASSFPQWKRPEIRLNFSTTDFKKDEFVDAYKMQIESLPFASSYIPTKGTPVTVAPDAIIVDSRNTPRSGLFTIAFCISPLGLRSNFDIAITFGRNRFDFIDKNRIRYVYQSDGEEYTLNSDIDSLSDNTVVCVVSDDCGVKLYLNGVLHQERTQIIDNGSPSDKIAFNDGRNGRWAHYRLRDFKLWRESFSSEQVAALGAA